MQRHNDIPQRAVGRWPQILACLGGIDSKYLKKRQGPCPLCGGRDRFRFDDKDKRGTFYCNKCGAGDGFRLLELKRGWDFKTAVSEVGKIVGNATPIKYQPAPEPDRKEIAKRIGLQWGRARTLLAGDPVLTYLKGRGIAPKRWRDVRFEPAGSALEPGSSMLALYRTADGWPGTLHTTPLQGGKKLFAKDTPIEPGGAVRLMGYKDTLGIAEGIETALSAYQIHKIPCWAALSAGLLEKWIPPQDVKKVIIFGDCDKSFTGQAVAYSLAKRLAQSLEVHVDIPSCGCSDWNDVLRKANVRS